MQVGLRCTTLLDGRHWDMNTLMHTFAVFFRLFTLCGRSGGYGYQELPKSITVLTAFHHMEVPQRFYHRRVESC